MRYINIRKTAFLCLLSLSCAGQAPTASVQSAPATRPATFGDKFAPDKLKADLDFLFKTIEEVHPNMYAYIAPDEFAKHRDNLYAQIDHPMDIIEFYKLTAPVVAKLKNGHTCLYPCMVAFKKYEESGGIVFPLEITWDGQDVIVRDNHGSTELPIGGTILRIGDEIASQVLDRISHYIPAECEDHNTSILGRSDLIGILMWIEFGNVESLRLRIKAPDGKVDDYNVKYIAMADLKKVRTQKNESEDKDSSRYYSYRYLKNDNVGLIEFNSFSDLDKFSKFLRQTFKGIYDLGIQDLIIDLRKNPGGNSSLGDELLGYMTENPIQQFEKWWIKVSPQLRQAEPGLIKHIAKVLLDNSLTKDGALIKIEGGDLPGKKPKKNMFRYTGRTYVLIGPETASSSVAFASYMRGKNLGILIGQETVDTTSVYGNVLLFHLPYSGIGFGVAAKYFQCVGGKPDGRGVIPHHEVKPDVEDIARGVDTVLEYTLKLIQEFQRRPSTQSAPTSGS